MATIEKSGVIKYKNSSGDTTIFYPKTDASLVDGLPNIISSYVDYLNSPVSMASTDGTTYTCTVPGITSLTSGASFIGVPAITSASNAVTLNVNNLGDKILRRRVSTNSATTATGYSDDWLTAGKPLRIMYDGLFWVVDMIRPYATDLMGVVPIANGGTGNSTGYITAGQKADTTLGTNATAEGLATTASGNYSHAEGRATSASSKQSHAEGVGTTASAENSHAEGYYTTASGTSSHAEGSYTTASGVASHAAGVRTTANYLQHVSGRYNTIFSGPAGSEDTGGSIFIVGNGSNENARSNAFRITMAGACMGTQSFTTSGADYAEYFEWADGNSDDEDRRGRFVTLVGEKIRIANNNDDYILGVVSSRPSVIGDGFTDQWQGMYLTDVFGENITETVEVPESTDEETGDIIPVHTETRFVLNPEYDHTQDYVGRELRKEWTPVGLVGKLVIIDDGTCEVDGYCKVSTSGGATKSTEKTPYRVMSRLDDSHIKVFIK